MTEPTRLNLSRGTDCQLMPGRAPGIGGQSCPMRKTHTMNTKTNQNLIDDDLTDEELDHEREYCERFDDAKSNYVQIVGEDDGEPESWRKANAALEELWAAYQASPCACAEKPGKAVTS
jgi:hypothetical protein